MSDELQFVDESRPAHCRTDDKLKFVGHFQLASHDIQRALVL